MPTFSTITLGGIPLSFPATTTNQYYQMEFVPVVGRQAISLVGKVMNLNLIYKRRWTLTFRPGENLENILELINSGSSVSFIDKDGATYNVYFIGEANYNPYPYDELGTMTVTFQEE